MSSIAPPAQLAHENLADAPTKKAITFRSTQRHALRPGNTARLTGGKCQIAALSASTKLVFVTMARHMQSDPDLPCTARPAANQPEPHTALEENRHW
jgi:hypothetical protein